MLPLDSINFARLIDHKIIIWGSDHNLPLKFITLATQN